MSYIKGDITNANDGRIFFRKSKYRYDLLVCNYGIASLMKTT